MTKHYEFYYEFETRVYFSEETSESDSEEFVYVSDDTDVLHALSDIIFEYMCNDKLASWEERRAKREAIEYMIVNDDDGIDRYVEKYRDELTDYFEDEAREQWRDER